MSRRTVLTGAATTVAGAVLVRMGSAIAGTTETTDWRAELSELERSYAGRIGAFAIDAGTGRTVGYRADERFPLLSTYKALAAGAVLHQARTREPGLLDRVIHYTQADVLSYAPVTKDHVADGMTVAALCEAAVGVSDNTAGNLILDRIGGTAGLTAFLRGIGDSVSRLDRTEPTLNDWSPADPRDTTTPMAAGCDLHALTAGRALHPDDRARLVGWLRGSTTGAARVRAGLPADWTVGDKTGSSSAYGGANDIAIAQPAAGSPVIIAVYTNRPAPDAGYEQANPVIASTATILARALGRIG